MERNWSVQDFVFTIELVNVVNQASPEVTFAVPNCISFEEGYSVLAIVLTASWSKDGSLLAHLLEGRLGFDSQGEVGLSYIGKPPYESPDDGVRVYFMQDELLLNRHFFETAAIEFGLAAMTCLRQASQPVSDDVEKRLHALRLARLCS